VVGGDCGEIGIFLGQILYGGGLIFLGLFDSGFGGFDFCQSSVQQFGVFSNDFLSGSNLGVQIGDVFHEGSDFGFFSSFGVGQCGLELNSQIGQFLEDSF
jgi:hypothetical protein